MKDDCPLTATKPGSPVCQGILVRDLPPLLVFPLASKLFKKTLKLFLLHCPQIFSAQPSLSLVPHSPNLALHSLSGLLFSETNYIQSLSPLVSGIGLPNLTSHHTPHVLVKGLIKETLSSAFSHGISCSRPHENHPKFASLAPDKVAPPVCHEHPRTVPNSTLYSNKNCTQPCSLQWRLKSLPAQSLSIEASVTPESPRCLAPISITSSVQ